jgi:transposase
MGTPRYSGEFKKEAVNQVIERGYSISEVARRIGVSWHSLHRWVKADPRRSPEAVEIQKKEDLAAEVSRLKSELRRVQEERDILRKAAAYFANQSG